ncbi:hypothetical protein BZA05DRAFT_470865 [Tricharina praecox]|uniref:uncharacterized protein n=1 Tax=Tricharina praecox TaxID=43433 RepID=UPI00221E75B5|nr:uncharacterized protein BZA05DRAFT_470865 [Tricharina praecox]KAI5858040.1 hypothetical protein BZA05DRAFT_470865 [Tricharina praecox]
MSTNDTASEVDLSESRQGELRTTVYSITILAAVFVALRFAARVQRGATFGIDDWMLVVALVFLFGLASLCLLLIHYGMGLHAGALSPYELTQILKTLVAQEVFYVTTNGLIKVSLLLMYCRIFTFERIKWPVLVCGFLAVGWSGSIVFVSVFQCNPVRKAWNPFMPGECIALKTAFIATGVPNIVTDILILCVPAPLVWGLNTTMPRRLSLLFIFSLGSFVVFASIYRFITIFDFETSDTSWTLAKAVIWCLVECSAGVISACLPTLRPLIKLVAGGFNSTNKNSEQAPTYGPAQLHVPTIGGSGNKSKQRHFKRIDDMVLRPDCNERNVTSTIERGELGSAGGHSDEIPLNAIGVRTDVEWSERSSIGVADKGEVGL